MLKAFSSCSWYPLGLPRERDISGGPPDKNEMIIADCYRHCPLAWLRSQHNDSSNLLGDTHNMQATWGQPCLSLASSPKSLCAVWASHLAPHKLLSPSPAHPVPRCHGFARTSGCRNRMWWQRMLNRRGLLEEKPCTNLAKKWWG